MNKLTIKILAIETSCDDTCAAVLINDQILSNVVSSQTDLHAKWGGVVPDIAKRAHQSRIKSVIATAFIRSNLTIFNLKLAKNREEKIERIIEEGMKKIDVVAVTQGPGLAIALAVGVNYAKELAIKYKKPLVAVNHIEGHIMANMAKNKQGKPTTAGKPKREINFPALALTVSGGHTKIILIQNPPALRASSLEKGGFKYVVVGETLDDAGGEALDKAAKLLGLGYPGGPVVERIALKGDPLFLKLPKPLADKSILDYSFSGLKTSFYYQIKDWPQKKINRNLANLAASFQAAVFEHLIRKFKLAIEKYQPITLMAAGGVLANLELRKRLRKMAREYKLPIYMPVKKILDTDNAGMIGVAGYFKALRKDFADPKTLDRDPRMKI